MYTIRKQFKMELAHQLTHAFSKCCSSQVHGHSYICELFFTSEELNKDGMVIDFGEVKQRIGKYIESWDHCLVMSSNMSQEYLKTLKKYNKNFKIVNYNPTAENMAKDMFDYVKKYIPELEMVRLYETATGWAEYYEPI